MSHLNMPTVSLAACHLLSMQTPTLGHLVLPNLLYIAWGSSWELMPFLRLFLSPGLVNVRILFPDGDPHPYRLAVVPLIPTKRLVHLTCSQMSPGNDTSLLEALRNLLDEASGTLRSVSWRREIPTTIFDRLLRLSNLRYLDVEPPRAPISPPEVVFPSLEQLVIRTGEVSSWLNIFEKIPNPALQDLIIHFMEDSPPDYLQVLGYSLKAANKEQSLTRFQCSWEDAITITEVELHPLLSFERLTTLVLRSCSQECTVQLDDPFVCRLAKALPRLETLRLGDAPPNAVTNVTVESLVALSTNCVDLDFLRIHFDATAIPSRSTYENSQMRKSSCKLRTLSVGSQPPPSGDDDILQFAFAIAHIFPHVEDIWGCEEGWRKVNQHLELFREESTIIPPFI